MALQNRATPLGEIVADPARGLVFGNRGCLHDAAGRLRRRYAGRRWIACRLEFRGRRRGPLMQPGRYTELFFLDDATALAAGHRPCAECRREDHLRLVARWREVHPGPADADSIDSVLHTERVDAVTRGQRRHLGPVDGLPDGAFVLAGERPWLVLGSEMLAWTPAGYAERRPRPSGIELPVITPPSLVAVLRGGWEGSVPFVHSTARRRDQGSIVSSSDR